MFKQSLITTQLKIFFKLSNDLWQKDGACEERDNIKLKWKNKQRGKVSSMVFIYHWSNIRQKHVSLIRG